MAPEIYVPLETSDNSELVLFARASTDARLLVKATAAAARPSQAERPPHAAVLSSGLVPPDSVLVIQLFAAFGFIAMLLAASGIFGVISQSVAQRTTEFGVRMAMGASAGQVLGMVLAREAKLIGLAAATGIVGTVLVTRSAFVEMLVITGTDLRMWIGVATLCGGLAAVAAAFATYRIVRLDPWSILRQS